MANARISDPALEHTDPETRGKCGFCGHEEEGYAKQDDTGKWQAACWNCVKPAQILPPQKRKPVGTVITEDLDAEERINPNKKPSRKSKEPTPKQEPTAAPAQAPAPEPTGKFDSAKAVELYLSGMSIGQVADALGCFKPGQGRNRTREALRAAGAYKEKESNASA